MHPFCKNILDGLRPSFDEIVGQLGCFFEQLNGLKTTPQDEEWHAEGDVHTHMNMVMDELYQLVDEAHWQLTDRQKLSLVLGTALHDIGKPFCTKGMEIKDVMRIAAPHHEYRGASYLPFRIPKLSLPKDIEQEVVSLVAYHHMPKSLVVKEKPKQDYARLARICSPKLLYLLEMADMKGRTCSDKEKQVDMIEFFKMSCEEHGVWDKDPYDGWVKSLTDELKSSRKGALSYFYNNAVRDYESQEIFTHEEALSKYYDFRDDFNELFVLCGPSGAGKSIWVERNLKGFHVVSMDMLRAKHAKDMADQKLNGYVRQVAREELKSHLRKKGKKIVWDATSLRRDFRSPILSLGFDYKALTTIVLFQKDFDEINKNNLQRKRNVPATVIKKQIDSFEMPELTEAHRFLIVGSSGRVEYSHGDVENEFAVG
ncbi:MAG: AAA family ATPase [Pseudobacteriovorax sp.]|nr:AAA family ATPase [Pseudobacteriovorax sp.]